MKWKRLPLCYELQSPLHIGFLPNQVSTLSAPTRLYVPGKNLWGAATAGLTTRLYDAVTPAHFQEIGDALRDCTTFSYFYLSDGKDVFIPRYPDRGLMWGELSDRKFSSYFVGSRISTAIEKEKGNAKDQSLHEIEYVHHRVRLHGSSLRKVLLIGVVWFQEDAVIAGQHLELKDDTIMLGHLDILKDLTLGGEKNYGFGRVRRVACPDHLIAKVAEVWSFYPETEIALGDDEIFLISHMPYHPDYTFFGNIEIIAGREYPRDSDKHTYVNPGQAIANAGYYFVPGTRIKGKDIRVTLDCWGRLIPRNG